MVTIFFDWDGTLADSMDLCVAEMRATFCEMGLDQLPDEIYRTCNGPTPMDSAEMMGIPKERKEEYLNIRRRLSVQLAYTHQKLFPGTQEMLKELSAMADLVIVSNGNDAYIRNSAKACGVNDYFGRIQAAVPGKTKGQLLGELLEQMKPDRAVMVGDMRGDFLAGRENGLMTFCADYGFGSESEKKMADRRASTVRELGEMLKSWCADQ